MIGSEWILQTFQTNSGSFCRQCDVTIAGANDRELIERGFDFNRKMEDVMELYNILTGFDDTADIKELVPNSADRGNGMTSKPFDPCLKANKNLPVLHSYINMLKWVRFMNTFAIWL